MLKLSEFGQQPACIGQEELHDCWLSAFDSGVDRNGHVGEDEVQGVQTPSRLQDMLVELMASTQFFQGLSSQSCFAAAEPSLVIHIKIPT